MADHAALNEARTLLAMADRLAADVVAEVAAMEAAIAEGQDGIETILRTGRRVVAEISYLGEALRDSHRQVRGLVHEMAKSAQLAADLRARWCTQEQATLPFLVRVDQLPRPGAWTFKPPLPSFAVATRAKLRALPLPAFQDRAEVWDTLAAEVRPFETQLEEALSLLEKARSLADRIPETATARRRRAGDRLKPTNRSTET